jgi:hypothetical protein
MPFLSCLFDGVDSRLFVWTHMKLQGEEDRNQSADRWQEWFCKNENRVFVGNKQGLGELSAVVIQEVGRS